MKRKVVWLSGSLLLALCSVACVAKNVVVKVDKNRVESEGVFYALPRTVVNAEVPVTKTVKKEGKHRNFTKCFFFSKEELKNPAGVEKSDKDLGIITKPEISYELGTPVISAGSEPDPDEI